MRVRLYQADALASIKQVVPKFGVVTVFFTHGLMFFMQL